MRKQINLSFLNESASIDISGTNDLFLMGPLTIIGGTISGYPSKSNIQDVGSLFAKEHNVVIQETRDTPSTTTKGTVGTKTPLEEEGRKKNEK